MNARAMSRSFLICSIVAVFPAGAQDKPAPKPSVKAPPPKAPAKPAAAPAAGGAKGPATAAAAKGPTTSAPHGATTSAPHGATTSAPHGATTSAPHGATTTAPAAAATGHPAAPHAGTAAVRNPAAPNNATRGGIQPKGSTISHTRTGDEVRMRPGGRPADVHVANRGMEIHHGLSGDRRVEVNRGDHRIVAERGGRGFVERPYRYGGREYGHRSYYYQGRAYDRFYAGYPYHGVYVQMYTPAYYYQPAFYGWAYNPWVAPVPYAWGWGGNPWYGYYGAYFTPYPVYPSASVWLTDYLISTSLATAYQARAEAAAADQAQAQAQMAGAAPLTPQVKDLISAEVQRQISVANAESQAAAQNAAPNPSLSGIQGMLNDHVQHIFVAGRSIDVVDSTGAECGIGDGDALQLTGPPPPAATAATLVVLSSKGGLECRAGSTVSVQVADLQDMQNHMRETIDLGLGELQTKQGKGGLPRLPPSAAAPPVKAAFAAEAPGPDASAATEIAQQLKEADQAEKEVISQVQQDVPSGPSAESPASAAPAPSVNIALGQSIADVVGQMGQPNTIADAGERKIYKYKDMKITFKNGKVSDIQ